MKYRLYVDEVGNPGLRASHDPNQRYLSLTGLILELDYVDRVVFPALESLERRYFGSHPDDPVILHRRELVQRKHPFETLRDPAAELAFWDELLSLLEEHDYVVLTAAIDKLEHQQRYQIWRFDPYHYCLTVLVERYVFWLSRRGAVGDVMAESRGGREDRRLKASFERVYELGSDFVDPHVIRSHHTSKELKVKTKSNDIAGLQLSGLIAYPSFRATLARRQRQSLPTDFDGKIARIVDARKYDRSPRGTIEGWGRKWLP